MYPKTIQKLIELFSKLPGVGPRTATRFVFYLVKNKEILPEEIAKALLDLKGKIKFCQLCFKPFEGEGKFCEICQDPTRNKKIICVVEKEVDLESIEKTKKYRGLYFVLGGPVSTVKKEEIEKLRIEELEKRIKKEESLEEIILAINPTTEGEAIALLLERKLKNFKIKISRLGRGLPVGGELEYADEETISASFEGRK